MYSLNDDIALYPFEGPNAVFEEEEPEVDLWAPFRKKQVQEQSDAQD